MSDTPKPERHIEVKLINSGRVLRTQALWVNTPTRCSIL